ncbi:MAG: GNAT family N-acetyltransferase [Steroidobacteraceae bacterium]
MSVRVITDESGFRELQPRWGELFLSNPAHGPYQSWQWNFTWWRHFGRDGDLRLILVEDGDRLLGIAPLQLVRRFVGIPLRHLRFLAHKRTDYTDFVVRAGSEPAFFNQMLTHWRTTNDSRFIEVRDLPESSPNRRYLEEQSARAGLALRAQPGEACVTVMLAPSFEEFSQALSKRFRKDIAYYQRSFERSFAADFRAVSAPGEIRDALQDLVAVYNARWRAEHGSTQFDDPAAGRFELELGTALAAAGLYKLYLLYADRKPVAGILAYVLNNRCYVERFAHSPDLHKYSVGTVLLAMTIRDGIAQGWTELDLMRGVEPYKSRWNGQTRCTALIRISRNAGTRRALAWIDAVYRQAVHVKSRLQTRRRAGAPETPATNEPAPPRESGAGSRS